jgi:hypothetical protein
MPGGTMPSARPVSDSMQIPRIPRNQPPSYPQKPRPSYRDSDTGKCQSVSDRWISELRYYVAQCTALIIHSGQVEFFVAS